MVGRSSVPDITSWQSHRSSSSGFTDSQTGVRSDQLEDNVLDVPRFRSSASLSSESPGQSPLLSPDPSDNTLVSAQSPVPVEPDPDSALGGGDVSVSSPDVTFLGFSSSSDEEDESSQQVRESAVRRSSESSEYVSASENPTAGPSAAGLESDQSGVSYQSAVSEQSDVEPKSDASSGELYSASRDSDLSSGSPPERPRFLSRIRRYPERARRRRSILTYESLGEPRVSQYKIPSLPRHLR